MLDTYEESPVQEGLNNPLCFTGPASLECHRFMKLIEASGYVEMYLILEKNSFIQLFDLLRWTLMNERPPWMEYRLKADGPTHLDYAGVIHPDLDKSYARPPFLSFRDLDDFRLTYGYSAIREGDVVLEAQERSMQRPMNAMFVEFPGVRSPNEAGLPREYVAFVDCQDTELIKAVLSFGQRLTVNFGDPSQGFKGCWRAEVKAALPGMNLPGTLVLHMLRPKADTRHLPVKADFDYMTALDTQVWLDPDVSDLASQRLVTCANMIYTSMLEDVQRYAIGRDLHENARCKDLFDGFNQNTAQIAAIMSTWDKSKVEAFEALKTSKLPAMYIQGPPGTGKSRFIRDLVKILDLHNHNVLLTAPSNVAADTLATAIETKYPEVGAIRYHSWHHERRAIRQNGSPEQDLTSEISIDPSAAPFTWQRLLAETRLNPQLWKSAKCQHPNFTTMSLNVRALQVAKVETGLSPYFNDRDDPFADVREMLKSNVIASGDEDAKDIYKRREKKLYVDTLNKARAIITTLSNCADSNLHANFVPQICIVDEAGQASELESFLPWVHNTSWSKSPLILFAGDPQQLPPVVKTFKKMKIVHGEERPVNPYAASMKMSHLERMTKLGHPVFLFTTQYRAAAGLSEVYSEVFYGGKLKDGPGTELSNRPKAREAIDFIKQRHHLTDGIPHLFLNVSSGICMTNENSRSRSNLHNVVATINEIQAILKAKLWTQAEIVITTPYRAQAESYRGALHQAKLSDIQVSTTDSFQGQEKECVFWDYVLAKNRTGGYGFVLESSRINLAISRARDHFVLVGDANALDPTPMHIKHLASLNDAERQERERMDADIPKHLRKVIEYFKRCNMTRDIDVAKLEGSKFVNWAECKNY